MFERLSDFQLQATLAPNQRSVQVTVNAATPDETLFAQVGFDPHATGAFLASGATRSAKTDATGAASFLIPISAVPAVGARVGVLVDDPKRETQFLLGLRRGRRVSPAPKVLSFAIAPSAFKVGPAATPRVAARSGAVFRYTLSKRATILITIERAHSHHPIGTLLRRHRPAGVNTLRFTGRIGRRALRPGAYVAFIVATDLAGNRSPRRRTTFTIVP